MFRVKVCLVIQRKRQSTLVHKLIFDMLGYRSLVKHFNPSGRARPPLSWRGIYVVGSGTKSWNRHDLEYAKMLPAEIAANQQTTLSKSGK